MGCVGLFSGKPHQAALNAAVPMQLVGTLPGLIFFYLACEQKLKNSTPLPTPPPADLDVGECAVTCGRRRYVLFPCKCRANNTLPTRLLLPPAVTKVT